MTPHTPPTSHPPYTLINPPAAPALSTSIRQGDDSPGSQAIDLNETPVSARFLREISHDFARAHLLLGFGEHDQVDEIVTSQSTNPAALHNTMALLGCQGAYVYHNDSEQIARRIDEAYASMPRSHDNDMEELTGSIDAAGEQDIDRLIAAVDRDLLSTEGKGPIVKLLDALLFDALGSRASDLHVQPVSDQTLIRYRIDGVLHTVREIPHSLALPLISRIKVIGRMDIAERRVPQDGRATVTIGNTSRGGRPIDLRISMLPTSYGERAVIRLLDTGGMAQLTDITKLGMPGEILGQYMDRASRSNGIVLVTGPTGSGKTTTLYATLRWLAAHGDGELNVMTIEDPIEYELSTTGVAISQAQVNTKKGVTFVNGLRHILRQDPDVVMVGEIRDIETARTAVQASLTGHLVFSTLHTNDAASSVTRLVDLGVEPYLAASSLSAVLAQRLVRRIHPECDGAGCDGCIGSGYKGRLGLFELLVVDEHIRQMITAGASASEIRERAHGSGMTLLHESGNTLAAEGFTTPEEIRRVAWGATGTDTPPPDPAPASRPTASADVRTAQIKPRSADEHIL